MKDNNLFLKSVALIYGILSILSLGRNNLPLFGGMTDNRKNWFGHKLRGFRKSLIDFYWA